MGSKVQVTPKEKSPAWLCKSCNKSFLTRQALRSHQIAKHPNTEKNEIKDNSKENNDKNVAKPATAARVSRRLQLKKGLGEENNEKAEIVSKPKPKPAKMQVKSTSDSVKTEFSCPKCTKVFPVYFHAQKHIQKRHTDDENEDSSSANSTELKPIRKDTCISCSEDITEDPSNHNCSKVNTYKCLGCEESCTSITAFNEHVSEVHKDEVDTMLFSNFTEFSTWKTNMEMQIKIKYSVLGNKQCSQCSYVSTKNMANLTYLCPSMIVSDVTADGIEVQYYKKHSGHNTPQYKALAEFKNKLVDNDVEENDKDLYTKFKAVMEEITLNAAKADTNILKKLINNANFMLLLVSNEDNHVSDVKNKSMSDNQITEELEGKGRKRKSMTPVPDAKKKKVEKSNSDSGSRPKMPVKPLVQSPSFNDSYKQFVDSSCKLSENIPKRSFNNSKTLKTKIGQFSPRKTSPRTGEKQKVMKPIKNNSDNSKLDDIEYEIREQENDCNILVLKI